MVKKHVSILVPAGAVALGCIDGPFNLFNKTNEFMGLVGENVLFTVQLVGQSREPVTYGRSFSVSPDCCTSDINKTDLIIIPAVNGDMKEVIAQNKEFLPWIVLQHQLGAEVASLCVGTFILAATGLLDGKKCATHWMAENEFKEMFPRAELVSNKIITDDKGIYTSGGANSFWNLLLYLLEKYTNRDMAIQFSKYYEIDIDRHTQSPFTMFTAQRMHKDAAIVAAQEFIEKNYQEKMTIEQLCELVSLSRRNFERRFKKATANTVVEYIQRVKIEAAKKDLETGRKNVNEVMYDAGYSDTKAFRSAFKKITGLLPIAYRNKYNKKVAA